MSLIPNLPEHQMPERRGASRHQLLDHDVLVVIARHKRGAEEYAMAACWA